MADEILNEDVALTIVRRLSGMQNYPSRQEGEQRMAETLKECADGVSHARAIVDEFDGERCPTIQDLRTVATRLAERCIACGFPKWCHERVGCGVFAGRGDEEQWQQEQEWKRDTSGWRKATDMVPRIPGVPWEVSLQLEAMKIHLGKSGTPAMDIEAKQDAVDFPEAVGAILSGRDPDYAQIEKVLAGKIPGWARRLRTDANGQQCQTLRMRTIRDVVQALEQEPEQ